MLRTTIAGLRAHARRMIATGLAVVFGVAFVAGTLIFGDTARAGFYDTFARTARNVDAMVDPPSGDRSQRLTADQVAAVSGLSAVDAVDARVVHELAVLDRRGKPIVNFDRVGFAISTDGAAALRGFDVEGALPAGTKEVLIDKETAAHQELHIGDTVRVFHVSVFEYRISGLIDFGVNRSFSGSSVVGLPAAEIARVTGSAGVAQIAVSQIAVSARPGVSQEQLADQIRAALGAGPRVTTGDRMRAELADDATSVATEFTFVLLIFGVISLIVAVFVIYNTFAILLAQRIRETALLRCVGATRRQIFTSVVLESAIVGLVGGALGIVLGVGVAYGLFVLLNGLIDSGVPAHAVVLDGRPVAIGLTLGLVVTVLAALIPAIRATRTAPLAALRDLPTGTVTSRAVRILRVISGIGLTAAGIDLTIIGWRTSDPEMGTYTIVAGGVVVFLGLLVFSPLFVGRLSALVGTPLRATTTGRLAVANARRNPGRTAITTATLMIGVGLMALFSVILASIRATAEAQLVGHYPVDYALSGVRYANEQQAGVPEALLQQIKARPEFPGVAVTRVVEVIVDGQQTRIAAMDSGTLTSVVKPEVRSGSLADLGAGTAFLIGERPHWRGRTLQAESGPLRVVGEAVVPLPGTVSADLLVTWEQLRAMAGPGDYTTVLVKVGDGISATASRDLLDSLTSPYPLVQINSMADLTDRLESEVSDLITLFGGLLGTAVLIALFGIANTLSLSVVERTRESATLRAIGLTRGQLRGTLVLEAITMGMLGALTGVTFGLVYGRLVVGKAFADMQPVVVVPWTWLAGLLAIAALASTLASLLPARRAARASIVTAMAET